jgi:hypothetical protein
MFGFVTIYFECLFHGFYFLRMTFSEVQFFSICSIFLPIFNVCCAIFIVDLDLRMSRYFLLSCI